MNNTTELYQLDEFVKYTILNFCNCIETECIIENMNRETKLYKLINDLSKDSSKENCNHLKTQLQYTLVNTNIDPISYKFKHINFIGKSNRLSNLDNIIDMFINLGLLNKRGGEFYLLHTHKRFTWNNIQSLHFDELINGPVTNQFYDLYFNIMKYSDINDIDLQREKFYNTKDIIEKMEILRAQKFINLIKTIFWYFRKCCIDSIITEYTSIIKNIIGISVGSTKISSDYDITMYGKNSDISNVIKNFKQTFNSIFKNSSSIVFDTNVYGVSFIIIGEYSPISDSPVSPTRRISQILSPLTTTTTTTTTATTPTPTSTPPGLISSTEVTPSPLYSTAPLYSTSSLYSTIKRPSLPRRRESGYQYPSRKLRLPSFSTTQMQLPLSEIETFISDEKTCLSKNGTQSRFKYFINENDTSIFNTQHIWAFVKLLTKINTVRRFDETTFSKLYVTLFDKTKSFYPYLIYADKIVNVFNIEQPPNIIFSFNNFRDQLINGMNTNQFNLNLIIHNYISFVQYHNDETYFTKGAFLDVVVNSQMCDKPGIDLNLDEYVDSFVENLSELIVHFKKPKYLIRAKNAFGNIKGMQQSDKIFKINKLFDDLKKNQEICNEKPEECIPFKIMNDCLECINTIFEIVKLRNLGENNNNQDIQLFDKLIQLHIENKLDIQ